MELLVGMEAAHFTWNVGDGKQVAGYPLPCSGVFVVGLFDDRYTLGADARISYPVVGLAGRIHLGREFLTMAIGTDVMVMFPVSGIDRNPSCTIRPKLLLIWSL